MEHARFALYLTNREALTVLCSVVKHAGSGSSMKEVSSHFLSTIKVHILQLFTYFCLKFF